MIALAEDDYLLFQITGRLWKKDFCAGGALVNGYCVAAAPIIKWTVGHTWPWIEDQCADKGFQMVLVRERLEKIEQPEMEPATPSSTVEPYNVGFTGTRDGTTKQQRGTLRKLMASILEYASLRPAFHPLEHTFFRHGDCIGSDESAHSLALQLDYAVIIHPPEDESLRAFCKGAFSVLPARPYLERNLKIVERSHILLACPKGFTEEKRGSGTWSTIRVAIKQGCPVRIIYHDGSFVKGT